MNKVSMSIQVVLFIAFVNLFLMYANDIGVIPNTTLYTDDTTLLASHRSLPVAYQDLQVGIDCVVKWMRRWKLRSNSAKTEIMCVVLNASPDVAHLQTFILHSPDDPTQIPITSRHKHLGVTLDSKLDWSHHFQNLEKRASSVVGILYGHLPHVFTGIPQDVNLHLLIVDFDFRCVLPCFTGCKSTPVRGRPPYPEVSILVFKVFTQRSTTNHSLLLTHQQIM